MKERRDGAIEGVRNRAQDLRLPWLDDSVVGHGVGGREQDSSFDGWSRLLELVQRSVDLGQAGFPGIHHSAFRFGKPERAESGVESTTRGTRIGTALAGDHRQQTKHFLTDWQE